MQLKPRRAALLVLMGRYLMRVCIALLLSVGSCALSFGDDDLPPSTIIVRSNTGNEVIHGDCQTKLGDSSIRQDSVTCNFSDVMILPPQPLDEEAKLAPKAAEYAQRPTPFSLAALQDQIRRVIQEKEVTIRRGDNPFPSVTEMQIRDYRKMLDKLQKSPSKAVEDAKMPWLNVLKEDDLKKILNDPASGPKTKEYWRLFFAAASSKDLVKLSNLSNAKQQQTCHANVTGYSIDFKKIGKRKWLSNEGPQGMCNVVRIYELDGGTGLANGLWTFVQKNITTGNTTNSMCKSISNLEKQPSEETFSWQSPDEFELPCEYIEWF